ncbi:hypothetical protein ABE137_06415 [Brevibacillus laterosporus]|uniref:hypothetical protein n=1 Tax=Brevibacillus TaxID=55080 RepID=UPI001B2E9490|nr:hypothetical protein [Brevibacillus halotolerans]GIO00573.1 hypothetical protein J5TS2_12410 [Brevibacillus halotolerans]
MENVELPARRIIGRVTKCAVVLAFIVWCISYDLPKRIESYGPKHVQTKQATKGFWGSHKLHVPPLATSSDNNNFIKE